MVINGKHYSFCFENIWPKEDDIDEVVADIVGKIFLPIYDFHIIVVFSMTCNSLKFLIKRKG
jgi:hypothetical protein